MTPNDDQVNGVALIRNVRLFEQLVERVVGRPQHLPGLATFHGFSGFGKTFAATFAANKYRAYYVEAGSTWSASTLCRALLVELGVPRAAPAARGTIADMVAVIIERLVVAGSRPLILDEVDHLVQRRQLDLIRELHDKSGAPIVLIGEEALPHKIAHLSERFHNRVLDWVQAEPADASDARALARLYCPEVDVRPELLAKIVGDTAGRTRRIVVNLARVQELARTEGLRAVGLKEWGGRPLYTGKPPDGRPG